MGVELGVGGWARGGPRPRARAPQAAEKKPATHTHTHTHTQARTHARTHTPARSYFPISSAYAGEPLSYVLSDTLQEGYYEINSVVSVLTAYPELNSLIGLTQITQDDATGSEVKGLWEAAARQVRARVFVCVCVCVCVYACIFFLLSAVRGRSLPAGVQMGFHPPTAASPPHAARPSLPPFTHAPPPPHLNIKPDEQVHQRAVVGVQKGSTPTTLSAISSSSHRPGQAVLPGQRVVLNWQ